MCTHHSKKRKSGLVSRSREKCCPSVFTDLAAAAASLTIKLTITFPLHLEMAGQEGKRSPKSLCCAMLYAHASLFSRKPSDALSACGGLEKAYTCLNWAGQHD